MKNGKKSKKTKKGANKNRLNYQKEPEQKNKDYVSEKENKKSEEIIFVGPASTVKESIFSKFSRKIKEERNKKEKIIRPSTIDAVTFLKKEKKVINLGRIFLGISIIFIGLIFLGQQVGWFGALNIHFLKLWPILLIAVGLSLFKVSGFLSKVIGILITILIFFISIGILLSSEGITNIILSGNLIQEEREIEDFSSIIFEGTGNISIKQEENTSFLIEADENIIREVITEVSDGILTIKYKNPVWNLILFDKTDVNIKLSTNLIEKIDFSGSGVITGEQIKSDTLEIFITGSGDVIMDVEVENLISRINGTGKFTFSGFSNRQLIFINGIGVYDARNLESNEVGIRISGSGDIFVNVEEELNVSISGIGTIEYKGDPYISKNNISGNGNITKVNSFDEKETKDTTNPVNF